MLPTLENVTILSLKNSFCLTDCGPSDGCNPDDRDYPSSSEEDE